MDNALENYRKMIEEFQDTSNRKRLTLENSLNVDEIILDDLLEKMSAECRCYLAKDIKESYLSGIFDILEVLEWFRCCKDMEFIVDSEALALGDFEGMGNDFIGRLYDWEWYGIEESKGVVVYKAIIDELVDKVSKHPLANKIDMPEVQINTDFTPVEFKKILKDELNKLSESEVQFCLKISKFTFEEGIIDILRLLDWYILNKNMKIKIEGEVLPINKTKVLLGEYIETKRFI